MEVEDWHWLALLTELQKRRIRTTQRVFASMVVYEPDEGEGEHGSSSVYLRSNMAHVSPYPTVLQSTLADSSLSDAGSSTACGSPSTVASIDATTLATSAPTLGAYSPVARTPLMLDPRLWAHISEPMQVVTYQQDDSRLWEVHYDDEMTQDLDNAVNQWTDTAD